MSFALLAFVLAFYAALSQASVPLNDLHDRQATTTSHPPVNGCQPGCKAFVWESHWGWTPVSVTGTVTYATIVYIVNDEGTTRTSTIFNELPEGMIPPPTNEAGTQTAVATVETELGKYTTVTVAYPTDLDAPAPSYDWQGVLPTVNAMNQFTCSTRAGLVNETGVELVGYTASITTEANALTGTKTRDPGGLLYTFGSYACQVGALLHSVPAANSDDGAIQYCETNYANCGVQAVQTVQFLTETSTSRERSTSRAPSSSSAVASRTPSTTPRSTSQGPLPVESPDSDSTTEQISSNRPPNTRPTSSAVAPIEEGSGEPAEGETSPAVFTTIVSETVTGEDGTSINLVTTEATMPTITMDGSIATTTEANVVVIFEPSTNESASSGPSSTPPVGDVIAGGLGISGSSTGSSSSSTAQSFPGDAPQRSIPSFLAVSVAMAFGYILLNHPL